MGNQEVPRAIFFLVRFHRAWYEQGDHVEPLDWFGENTVVRRSMQDLLQCEVIPSDDLVFVYGQRVWDPTTRQVISREVELKQNGSNIQVTNENKRECVAWAVSGSIFLHNTTLCMLFGHSQVC